MIIRPMTIRERFNRVFHWEKPDRVPPDVTDENYLYCLEKKKVVL